MGWTPHGVIKCRSLELCREPNHKTENSSINLKTPIIMNILVIILILLLLGGGGYGFSSGNHFLGGGASLIVIILIILLVTGRI